MELGSIISLGGLGITILGVAALFGRVYQTLNDVKGRVVDLEKDITLATNTGVIDGNRITRLEAQYGQILSTLGEIKADVRRDVKNT